MELGDTVIEVGFNPFKNKKRLKTFNARLVTATNYSGQKRYRKLNVTPETDNSVRLKLPKGSRVVRARKGVVHLAVQLQDNGHADWQYVEDAQANVTIFAQPDLRGKMIYQAWPAYLGVYSADGNIIYDEKGRAIPGTFKTIEEKLPSLKEQGYTYIYVMGVYQLDRPENIIGQEGPDASLFSPLEFNISKAFGGGEGLKNLL